MEKELPVHPIQLVEVTTKKINAEKFDDEIKDEKIDVNFDPNVSYNKIDDNYFNINFKVSISTEPQKLFDINVELTGKCKLVEEGDYDIEKFANGKGIALLWPYAREIVANITQRFGFPALVLPTLRIGHKQ
ncbi:MAG: protein-export chaperone SecB [Candidatus Woesearchaeota archaeon]